MLIVIMLSVIMLIVIMLSEIMLSFLILSYVMLSVVLAAYPFLVSWLLAWVSFYTAFQFKLALGSLSLGILTFDRRS